jgi:mono/diheme cytochrome c family protein
MHRTAAAVTGAAFAVIVLAVSLSAAAEGSFSVSGGDRALALQVQSEGRVAFDRQCAGCHGGNGQGAIGPDLRHWTGSVEETATVIAQGAERMPAFSATMTTEQIEALARYLDELVGTSVYARACAACHGAIGEGGIGPSLKVSELADGDRRSVIENGAGQMRGFADDLTETEIGALVWRTAGYRSVGPAIYATQCAPCHGVGGQGLTGPSLIGSSVSPQEAVTIVSSGSAGMPAFGAKLDPGDVEAIVAFALGLDSVTAPTAPTTTTARFVSAIDIYAGSCASCHGLDAEGGIGPPLVGLSISDEELDGTIVEGRGSMPSFSGVLGSQEVAALVEFLQTLAEPSSTEATEAGAGVYAEQCAACHGADGRGGLGPSLRTTLLSGDDLRGAIARGNATMPAFARTLSSSDLELAAEFVGWLKQAGGPVVPLRGGSVIYRQDCSACHGDRGEGGIGPVLQSTALTINEIIARVYGGHAAGMPAFAGALDGRQVRDVAHFIKTFERSAETDSGLGTVQIALLVGAGIVALAAASLTIVRVRRRPRAHPPEHDPLG